MNMTEAEADAVFAKNMNKWVGSQRQRLGDYIKAGLSADWEYPDLCQEARIAAWQATRRYAQIGDPAIAKLDTYVLGAVRRHMSMIVGKILTKCRMPYVATDFPNLDGSRTWHFKPAPVILYDEFISWDGDIQWPGLYLNADGEGLDDTSMNYITERVPTPEQYMLQREDELVAKAIRLRVLSILDEREKNVLLGRAFPPAHIIDMSDWNNAKLAKHLGLTLNQVNHSLFKIKQTINDVVGLDK